METGLTIHKANTPAEMRRQMLNVPAVMTALEPVEKSVFLASTAKTIAEYSGLELSNELNKILRFVAKDVGYRATDESERGYMVIRISEILKRYYPNLTMKDFRMAFEMCITGELDEFLPKGRDGQPDRGHYQQFNAEYVCKILNAYKIRRAFILRKANEAMPKPERERDTDAERIYGESIRKDMIDAYAFYRENKRMPAISAIAEMLFYKMLSDAGLAPEIVVTKEDQQIILQRALNDFSRFGMIGDVRRLQQAGPDAPELQHGALTLARKKALNAAFERMVADGIEITDYIKFE